MRTLNYRQVLAITGTTPQQLPVLRQRHQIALAFGRSDMYESLGYIDLDCVAVRLTDVIAEGLPPVHRGRGRGGRTLAAEIIRDQWGPWSRVVAMAEAAPGLPVFFYVIEFENKNQQHWWLTVGSKLDPHNQENLLQIVLDIKSRFGVTPLKYVAVDMTEILADVRRAAEKVHIDLRSPFLPPWGDPRLDEILKPLDESAPDRAIVPTGNKKEQTKRAQRDGKAARAALETMPGFSRLQ